MQRDAENEQNKKMVTDDAYRSSTPCVVSVHDDENRCQLNENGYSDIFECVCVCFRFPHEFRICIGLCVLFRLRIVCLRLFDELSRNTICRREQSK